MESAYLFELGNIITRRGPLEQWRPHTHRISWHSQITANWRRFIQSPADGGLLTISFKVLSSIRYRCTENCSVAGIRSKRR